MHDNKIPAPSLQENYLLSTYPLIRKIIRRKIRTLDPGSVEDIVQTVALKLWRWKCGGKGHDLTEEEWQKLANRAAQNEVKDYLESIAKQSVCCELRSGHLSNGSNGFHVILAGDTDHEAFSLLKIIWQSFDVLSLREKYSILLKKQGFIKYLMLYRLCDPTEIAQMLGLTTVEIIGLIKTLPLPDKNIAKLLESRLETKVTSKQVLEARLRAKNKLYGALSKVNDERTLFAGRTSETSGHGDKGGRTR